MQGDVRKKERRNSDKQWGVKNMEDIKRNNKKWDDVKWNERVRWSLKNRQKEKAMWWEIKQ